MQELFKLWQQESFLFIHFFLCDFSTGDVFVSIMHACTLSKHIISHTNCIEEYDKQGKLHKMKHTQLASRQSLTLCPAALTDNRALHIRSHGSSIFSAWMNDILSSFSAVKVEYLRTPTATKIGR